jgi:hypothetical protein
MAPQVHPLSRPGTHWLVSLVMVAFSAALLCGFVAAVVRATARPDPTGVVQLREALHVHTTQRVVRLARQRRMTEAAARAEGF